MSMIDNHDADTVTFAMLCERAERNAAERDAALAELAFVRGEFEIARHALLRLLDCTDRRSYMTQEQQDARRLAERIAKGNP